MPIELITATCIMVIIACSCIIVYFLLEYVLKAFFELYVSAFYDDKEKK